MHELAMMISIALRFIPDLLDEAKRIMKAQASRGADFNEGSFMEKIKSICVMRELFKALSELETRLMEQYGVSLNEAMALCCIGGDTLTASVISENTGLSASHTSKVIRSIEEKELIVRNLGDKDKRQMHFTLSDKGHECLEALKANEIEIPELLKPLFK